MKSIESLIIPRGRPERAVTVFGKHYVFKQLAPGRFVAADVDEAAADALIATGAYREFTDKLKPAIAAPTAAKPEKAAAPAPAPAPPPAGTENPQTTSPDAATTTPPPADSGTGTTAPDAPTLDPETVKAAELLLGGHPNAIKKQALTAPRAVVGVALTLEKSAKRVRASVVAGLEEALKAGKG